MVRRSTIRGFSKRQIMICVFSRWCRASTDYSPAMNITLTRNLWALTNRIHSSWAPPTYNIATSVLPRTTIPSPTKSWSHRIATLLASIVQATGKFMRQVKLSSRSAFPNAAGPCNATNARAIAQSILIAKAPFDVSREDPVMQVNLFQAVLVFH